MTPALGPINPTSAPLLGRRRLLALECERTITHYQGGRVGTKVDV